MQRSTDERENNRKCPICRYIFYTIWMALSSFWPCYPILRFIKKPGATRVQCYEAGSRSLRQLRSRFGGKSPFSVQLFGIPKANFKSTRTRVRVRHPDATTVCGSLTVFTCYTVLSSTPMRLSYFSCFASMPLCGSEACFIACWNKMNC